MKEPTLRKLHRRMGETLILFLGLQVLAALIFSLARLQIIPYGEFVFFVRSLHLGGGLHGDIYRLILAVAVLFHGLTGITISLRIRARKTRNNRSKD
jgi:succinate dehydrogenase/fumarate reductase cytochrome b subunit